MELKSNTFIIILAAGYATRLKPFSDKVPKPLIEINGKTIISRIISNFKEAGFNNFCIVLGYKKEMIKKKMLKEKNITIDFIEQKEPTGMADAIFLAFRSISKKYKEITNFFISAADVIFSKKNLLNMYKLYKHSDVVLSLMKSNDIKIAKGHGNVKISEDSDLSKEFDANQGLRIIDIIEKPKSSQIMSEYYSLPLYLTSREIEGFMKNLEISRRGEKEFQDVLKTALLSNLDIRGIRIISPIITIDNIGEFHLTTLQDIIKMNKRYLDGIKISPLKGKTPNIIEPLKIGNEKIIRNSVLLGPYVIIGDSCKIGDFSKISNTILYDNVNLGKSCILEWCIVDQSVSLPDFYNAKNCFITRNNEKDLEIINF